METWQIISIVAVGVLALAGTAALLVHRRRTDSQPPKGGAQVAFEVGSFLTSLVAKELAPLVGESAKTLFAKLAKPRSDDEPLELAADGTITLAFSDIQDSTTLNVELGDERWVALLNAHDEAVRRLVRARGGHVIKSQGDGYMLAFREAVDAVSCSIDLQRHVATDFDIPLKVRVGVHTGPAITQDGDVFGANVAFAARVSQQAVGGQILVSDQVRDRLDGTVALSRQRSVRLKGLPGRHRVYSVRWRNVA